jgi:hypothetical protein
MRFVSFLRVYRVRYRIEIMNAEEVQQNSLVPVPAGNVALEFRGVKLWPEPVDGAETLREISSAFDKHLVLTTGTAEAVAAWIAQAYCTSAFLHAPRLASCSPEPGCGKTTFLTLIECFVPRPFLKETPTDAALSRLIRQYQPTLLLDEYDTWLPDGKSIVSLLNSGHRQGSRRLRCVGAGGIKALNVYGAVALAGIGQLPPTLESRSLIIRMTRPKPTETREPFDGRFAETELGLGQKIARWVFDHYDQLRLCRPALPPKVVDRQADNWRPLFAVAVVAGGDWPERVRRAFTLLRGESSETTTIGTQLLSDIRDLFTTLGADKLPSQILALEIAKIEGRPWVKLSGLRPICPNEIAVILRPYGIGPTTIRFGAKVAKGYRHSDFEDAFARFLS